MIWTFELREDVTFHDGTEFTSEDVRRSWEIITSESSIATGASDFRNLVGQAENIMFLTPTKLYSISPSPGLNLALTCQRPTPLQFTHWDRVGEDGYLNNPAQAPSGLR